MTGQSGVPNHISLLLLIEILHNFFTQRKEDPSSNSLSNSLNKTSDEKLAFYDSPSLLELHKLYYYRHKNTSLTTTIGLDLKSRAGSD